MKDIMVDLETMGTGYRAAIVSIGAVRFDPVSCKVGCDDASKFYYTINLDDCQAAGQTIDANTVIWWLTQSSEAQFEITNGGPRNDLVSVLTHFGQFAKGHRVWGNGSNFDNRILREAYELIDQPCPWHYRDDRDMRTIVALGKSMGIKPSIEFDGVKHHGLHDAIFQAQIVCEIYLGLRRRGK